MIPEDFPDVWPTPLRPRSVRPADIGTSGARVWRGETPDGPVAIRRWPVGTGLERVRLIHAALEAAIQAGISVIPARVRALDGSSAVASRGRVWEMESWRPGAPVTPGAIAPTALAEVMAAFGRWHTLFREHPLTGWPHATGTGAGSAACSRPDGPAESPAWQRRAAVIKRWLGEPSLVIPFTWEADSDSESETLIRRTLASWESFAQASRSRAQPGQVPETDPSSSRVGRGMPVTLCFIDSWRGNLLFEDDRLTGIIDFAQLAFDHPAVDLARALGTLLPDDPRRWSEAFAAYRAHAPFTEADELFTLLLDQQSVVAAALRWLERARANPETARRHRERWRECVERLERLAAKGWSVADIR